MRNQCLLARICKSYSKFLPDPWKAHLTLKQVTERFSFEDFSEIKEL